MTPIIFAVLIVGALALLAAGWCLGIVLADAARRADFRRALAAGRWSA
jgi:hypothetical protein